MTKRIWKWKRTVEFKPFIAIEAGKGLPSSDEKILPCIPVYIRLNQVSLMWSIHLKKKSIRKKECQFDQPEQTLTILGYICDRYHVLWVLSHISCGMWDRLRYLVLGNAQLMSNFWDWISPKVHYFTWYQSQTHPNST